MDVNSTENELLEKARNGDGNAFGELIRTYESMIFNTVMGLVNNYEDAQDITQDAFFKAYRSLKSFRGECKFSSWLYRIAVNTAKDYLRSASRHPTVSLDDGGEDEDGDEQPMQIADESRTASPETSAEINETQRIVRMALSRISEAHRKILILRDMEGYSYDEIAEMLDIELGTVKSRINRARQALKQELIKMRVL